MWLLNVTNYQLKSFMEGSIPKYAILSHTWTDDEITFKDITQDLRSAQNRPGWQKIARCCRRAKTDGHDWVWIDTCCIDKSSSAELSEAINSMWQYYKNSQVCYAYLADVPAFEGVSPSHLTDMMLDQQQSVAATLAWKEQFAKSRWFTRGWTLQELLAPRNLVFVAQDWSDIALLFLLADTVSTITGIEKKFLQDQTQPVSSSVSTTSTGTSIDDLLRTASIACKMSWASRRQTTRTEDMAYCLLGIFDINMPLLYGEGKKAFIRLQLELMRVSSDQSIFAWRCPADLASQTATSTLLPPPIAHLTSSRRQPPPEPIYGPQGVLAESPSWFTESGHVLRARTATAVVPITITNIGIRVTLEAGPMPPRKSTPPSRFQYDHDADLRLLQLSCFRLDPVTNVPQKVGICVRTEAQLNEKDDKNHVVVCQARAFPDYVHFSHDYSWSRRTVYLRY